ncbi:hypothetical protein HMPREF1978_01019 [Actinomyces graevenitzii F0530]|uniref:Uncharacterized protein n=1 Tax=Actinomyces graevenitzii F0530 TaxID=1321817 RepID=U1Q2S4_9ACTO|nr:hypothetical protein HMPREF1978_01019 [Actinomyces graevenitzii F0530]
MKNGAQMRAVNALHFGAHRADGFHFGASLHVAERFLAAYYRQLSQF